MTKRRGRPPFLRQGRRVDLYLPEEMIQELRRIGGGNASQGVMVLLGLSATAIVPDSVLQPASGSGPPVGSLVG